MNIRRRFLAAANIGPSHLPSLNGGRLVLRDGRVDPVAADHALLAAVQRVVELFDAQLVDGSVEEARRDHQRDLLEIWIMRHARAAQTFGFRTRLTALSGLSQQ